MVSTTTLRAAVLVTDGYLDLELWYPFLRLREAGADVVLLGPAADSTYHSTLGYPVIPDRSLSEAGDGFDLVIVPGGDAGPKLANDAEAVALVSGLAAAGAKVATIGSGSQLASAAGVPVSASIEDADGLPELLRALLASS